MSRMKGLAAPKRKQRRVAETEGFEPSIQVLAQMLP